VLTNVEVDAVNKALNPIDGIESLDVNLQEKRVIVTGSTPPSLLLAALKSTGLTTIVRGQGSKSHLGAAVCIFEHYPEYQTGWAQYNNRGLARMIQVICCRYIGNRPSGHGRSRNHVGGIGREGVGHDWQVNRRRFFVTSYCKWNMWGGCSLSRCV